MIKAIKTACNSVPVIITFMISITLLVTVIFCMFIGKILAMQGKTYIYDNALILEYDKDQNVVAHQKDFGIHIVGDGDSIIINIDDKKYVISDNEQ